MIKYTATAKDNAIKIYINSILHLSIRQEDIIGFQAWIEGEDTLRYIIEFYTQNKNFICGYNEHKKWVAILNVLDKLDLYSHYNVE